MFLLEFAHEFRHRQFVFLTPLDLTALKEAEAQLLAIRRIQLAPGFVRTVRMKPPRPAVA